MFIGVKGKWLVVYNQEMPNLHLTSFMSPLYRFSGIIEKTLVYFLRGLRVWVRTPEDGEYLGRSLLSYRDYAPHLDRKNLFSRDYEDVMVLLERLNGYLASRTSPARIVSVETVVGGWAFVVVQWIPLGLLHLSDPPSLSLSLYVCLSPFVVYRDSLHVISPFSRQQTHEMIASPPFRTNYP